jgi:putative PIN family toxin of toxin-antitoxin system
MRAVVDTNEMLRMASAWQTPLAPMVSEWRNGRFEIALSPDLLAEFESVATRPSVRRFLPAVNVREFVAFARQWAIFVKPADTFPHCRDPKDDVVIATAIAAHAEYIVTNDGDLHEAALVARLRDECGIQVVWPNEFLETLMQSR